LRLQSIHQAGDGLAGSEHYARYLARGEDAATGLERSQEVKLWKREAVRL